MSHAEVDHNAMNGDDPDSFPRPFGQYLLLENFARGGMGEVYLAKIGGIAGLERYCVLKKLRAELTRDREYVTRFIDEARVVVTLNHANICHVFDVGRVGEEYYLAMEYIAGRDVRTAQDCTRTKEKNFPPATALHLVIETLEALDYAHRRNHPLTGEPLNLVHRDVSPQNVLVSFEGEVKLIDFGLAASRLKVERTQPNVVMGKMAYMAPEQARGDPIDARADLFACGVLAYELLSGERFYEGMTANDIWQVAGKGGFIPRRWSAIDVELGKHLAKALHPDPKKRFATCGDFREALASHLHWKFPGTGVRGLREIMNELFADEVRKERELQARFGKVTVAGFRTEFEDSRSTSVSLARADEDASAAHEANTGARLVRNEQSQSAPAGSMPPPTSREGNRVRDEHTRDTVIRERGASGERAAEGDLHREATRLMGARDVEGTNAEKRNDRSTDEQTGSAVGSVTARREAQLPAEPTQRVRRTKSSSLEDSPTELAVKPMMSPDDDVTIGPGRSKWMLPLAGTTAVIGIVVVIYLLSQGTNEPKPKDGVTSTDVVQVDKATPVAAVDKAALDKAALDQAALDQAALDEAALDKAALDKAALDKAALDQAALDQAALDQAALDKAALDKAALDKAALNDPKLRADAKAAELEREARAAEKQRKKQERAAERATERAAAKEQARIDKERADKERADKAAAAAALEKADKPEKRGDRKAAVAALRDNDVGKVTQTCAACTSHLTRFPYAPDKAAAYLEMRSCLIEATQCKLPTK